jgi:hypothetical protein
MFAIFLSWSIAPASIAGVLQNVLLIGTKLQCIANSATENPWFSTFLENALVPDRIK